MNPLFFVPFAVTAPWVADISEVDDINDLEIDSCNLWDNSTDPDEIMSAFTCNCFIPYIEEDRLIDMIRLRPDVMRECIRLLQYSDDCPSSYFLIEVGELILNDLTASELLLEAWMVNDWFLTPEFVFAVQNSYSAWRLLHEFNPDEKYTSLDLINHIDDVLDVDQEYLKSCINALIATNGSVLEYLLHIDELHGDGIKATIATINKFKLWNAVLSNPVAPKLIDYVREDYYLVMDGAFTSKQLFMNWLIPQIQETPFVSQYATVGDIELNIVGPHFYKNAFAVDIIEQYLQTNDITEEIMNGLLIIACSEHEQSSISAIKIIRQKISTDGVDFINPEYFIMLLRSPFGRESVIEILTEHKCDWKDGLIRMSNVVPYWVPGMDYAWKLLNLTPSTAQNIHLTSTFWEETEQFVDLLSYNDWIILLDTEFGVKLGVKYIGCVVDKGVTFKLFRSPFLNKDDILSLSSETDVFECLGDDEYFSIINRDDAFVISARGVRACNNNLCNDILTTFYDPLRVTRFAEAAGMDLRSYLNLVC